MDDRDIVSAVRALVADRVGRDKFELWFGGTQMSFAEGVLTISAANRFTQDWLRIHYRPDVETAYRKVLGTAPVVEFRHDEALAAPAAKSRSHGSKAGRCVDSRSQAHDGSETGLAVLDAPDDAEAGNRPLQGQKRASASVKRDNQAVSSAKPSSTVGAGPRRRFATLDTFVVGPPNRLAHATARMVVEKPGSLTPLVMYGPAGCGKTHLLEGIWSGTCVTRRGTNAVFLSAEQFTTMFIDALRGSGLPNFRRKYRGVDLLIVDDLQFLVGKRATVVELLHTIDALQRDGKQLVFSADRAPAELSELGSELTTRLSSGMACRLEPPDPQTRFGLVREFARRLNVELSDEVTHYVATHVTTGAREISGAVNRLHAANQILNMPINRTLAEESLAEIARHHGRAVRLTDIERAVCHVFGLSNDSLQSGRRAKSVSSARMLAMWLARKHTRAGLAEIGQYFGRRSHSTVISAQRRVSDWLARQSEVDLSDRRCQVEEAIRRVEQQFRAG